MPSHANSRAGRVGQSHTHCPAAAPALPTDPGSRAVQVGAMASFPALWPRSKEEREGWARGGQVAIVAAQMGLHLKPALQGNGGCSGGPKGGAFLAWRPAPPHPYP